MIARLVYAGFAAGIVLSIIWGYGEARYNTGRSDYAVEQAAVVNDLNKKMAKERQESQNRLAVADAKIRQKEKAYRDVIEQLRFTSEKARDWMGAVVPVDIAGLIWMRDNEDGSGSGRLQLRPDLVATVGGAEAPE